MRIDPRGAHQHSSNHREEVLNSDLCGCFYCLKTFKPSKIIEWCDFYKDAIGEEEYGHTALCPYCGIDSVIGSKSGYPIASDFLGSMNKLWF